MKNRKKIIVSIIMIFLLVIVTIGVTFAVFSFIKQGTVENTLETSTVVLTYTEGKTGIMLNEAYPISDQKGKVLVGENNVFDFTVQATLGKSTVISYEVSAVKLPINDVTSLEDDEVKLYLEKAVDPDTTYQQVMAPSNFLPMESQSEVGSPIGSMILDSGIFMEEGTTIHNYRLRMWVDESAEIPNGESRKYGVKVNVYAKQLASDSFTDQSCFTFDSTTGTITGYSDECSSDVVIPYTIDGVKVTAIGDKVFANRTTRLTSVILPNTITSIGENAFYGNRLTSLSIPNSVTNIGNSAFVSNRLTELVIPATVENIEERAFMRNEQLANLIISNGVKTIGKEAFSGCQLTKIIIPDSVISVGNNAFEMNQLTSVTIQGETSIGIKAFYNNKITKLSISRGVTNIGAGAFVKNQMSDDEAFIYNRNSDGSIDYTSLNSYASVSRDNITIPDTITSIGDWSFYDLQLSNITLPDSITSIGYYAFSYNQLTEVTIPKNVTKIDRLAFMKSASSNISLSKIINKTGRSFNWKEITSANTYATFVTGTITHRDGNIAVISS